MYCYYYLAIVVILLVLLIWQKTRKPANFPPGPPRLPMIGSLLCMHMQGSSKHPSLLHSFQDAAKRYGPLVGFYLGGFPALLVSDFDTLRDLFKKEELTARPPIRPNNECRPGWELPELDGRNPGVILSHGKYWREQRRFTLRHLRDFGFGKTSMEDILNEEVTKLCHLFKKEAGHPIDLNRTMNVSIINALWSIVVGEKFELDNPKFATIIRLIDDMLKNGSPISAVTAMLPHWSMAKWPILDKLSGYYQGKQTFKEIAALVEPYFKEHLQTLDPENPRDFTDVFLMEIQAAHDPTSSFYGETGRHALLNVIIDLFLAGQETTASSLIWIFFYMAHHPEVQEKVHQEIDLIVGKNRLPSLDDRDSMPYVNAVILECFRTSSVIYSGVPHYAMSDIKVKNYTIPKGTFVFGNLYGIMHDPAHFKDPERFNPERFLATQPDGSIKYVPDDRVIPFSIGKRSCLGQTLAEKEFYLFFTGIMQQFQVGEDTGSPLPNYDLSATHPKGPNRPAPAHKVVLISRT